MIILYYSALLIAVIDYSILSTTGYELEMFHDRSMTCSTLIIPVLYSIPVITTALGKQPSCRL